MTKPARRYYPAAELLPVYHALVALRRAGKIRALDYRANRWFVDRGELGFPEWEPIAADEALAQAAMLIERRKPVRAIAKKKGAKAA